MMMIPTLLPVVPFLYPSPDSHAHTIGSRSLPTLQQFQALYPRQHSRSLQHLSAYTKLSSPMATFNSSVPWQHSTHRSHGTHLSSLMATLSSPMITLNSAVPWPYLRHQSLAYYSRKHTHNNIHDRTSFTTFTPVVSILHPRPLTCMLGGGVSNPCPHAQKYPFFFVIKGFKKMPFFLIGSCPFECSQHGSVQGLTSSVWLTSAVLCLLPRPHRHTCGIGPTRDIPIYSTQ